MSKTLPLTSQQQWLWSLLQCQPEWPCVLAHAYRLQGALDVTVLQESVRQIARRYDSLRARVVVVDGEARQVFDEGSAEPLEIVSVAGVSKADGEARARRIVEELIAAPVDLALGPLWNARLLQLSDTEHWFVLSAHRLVADCFSQDHLVQQLWALYGDLLQGNRASLSQSFASYADYAVWQLENYSQWCQKHGPYWTERLGSARALSWSPDEGVASTRCSVLGSMNSSFGVTLSNALIDLARRTRTLSANAMLAVYAVALWQWCGQTDFVVPVFVAGRQAEHKGVVGYFSHLLYLRIQLTGRETFTQLLGAVSNEFYRALSHQDFGRMATRRPELFSGAFFQWLTWRPEGMTDLPGDLRAEPIPIREFGEGLTAIPPGMVDVEVSFFETTEGIYASGVYRADRFAPATMARFMADLRSATEQLVQQPDAPLTASCPPGGNRRLSCQLGQRAVDCSKPRLCSER